MSPSFDWVFALVAAVLGVGGCALAALALFWDRSRGRRRCPGCWYNLEGATADAEGRFSCPECGRVAPNERGMHRTRRRWGRAALALFMLLVAGVVWQVPLARKRGWMFLIPDRVIFNAVPIGGLDGAFGDELQRRLGCKPWPGQNYEKTLSEARCAALLRRAAAGNVLARPIGPAWRESYGRLIKERGWNIFKDGPFNSGSGSAEIAAAVDTLDRIPYELTVRTRDKWPAGMAPEFEFKVDQWWPPGTADQVVLDWATGNSKGSSRGGRGQFPLPIKDTGQVAVDLSIQVQQENYATAKRAVKDMGGKEKRSVAYTTVGSIDDILGAVESPEVDQAIVKTVHMKRRGNMVQLESKGLVLAEYADTAFGMVAELSHNGKVVMTAHARWLGATPDRWTFGNVDTPGGWKKFDEYVDANINAPGWTLRLYTDPQWSLAIFDAKRYWKGDLTFPTQIEVEPISQPAPPPTSAK